MSPTKSLRDVIGSGGAFLAFAGSGLLNVFSWLSLALQLRPQNYQVPVHYSSRFGVDATGPWYSLFYLPLLGLALLALNIWLAGFVRGRSAVLVYFVAFSTLLIEALILITTFLFLGRL